MALYKIMEDKKQRKEFRFMKKYMDTTSKVIYGWFAVSRHQK